MLPSNPFLTTLFSDATIPNDISISKLLSLLEDWLEESVIGTENEGKPRRELKVLAEELRGHIAASDLPDLERVKVAAEIERFDNNFDSVVLVMRKDQLEGWELEEEEYVTIQVQALQDRQLRNGGSLAPSILFGEQPSLPSLGSGFFIENDVIVTAAHILLPYRQQLQELVFVRNLHLDKALKINGRVLANTEVKIPRKDIFEPVLDDLPVTDYHYSTKQEDWAVVKVKDDARRPRTAYRSNADTPWMKQECYCAGHGLGLPKKISLNGEIIRNNPQEVTFEAKLDVFYGNSGSPVFFSDTNELAGMLVRGSAVLAADQAGEFHLYPAISNYEAEECQRITPELLAVVEHLSQ